MKKSPLIIFFGMLLYHISFSQDPCLRHTFFGPADICLPRIDGYEECYLDKKVAALADGTEVQMNMILGFYLNTHTYNRKDSLGLFPFDNYFKVYATKELKNQVADHEVLKQVQKMVESNYISKNWETYKSDLDKIGLNIDFGVPVLIKSYSINKNSFTSVMLLKVQSPDSKPITIAMTMNGILVKQRLIWMAYYLHYENEKTIQLLEKNSNFVLENLVKAQD